MLFYLSASRRESLDPNHIPGVQSGLLHGDVVRVDHILLVHHRLDLPLVGGAVRVVVLVPALLQPPAQRLDVGHRRVRGGS